MQQDYNPHDLDLPDWGPYTKKYIGISHIANKQKGVRFDVSVFPGFYRRKVGVPNVMWESDYHPWEASTDLSYYTHRHELEWKDKVYSDITFVRIDPSQNLIRCDLVNNTATKQNLVLHYMGSIHFPALKAHGDPIGLAEIQMPEENIWVDALDYEQMELAVRQPQDFLTYDGFYRGEERVSGFVNGSGLGKGFGKNTGDRVLYRLNVSKSFEDAVMMIRYRMNPDEQVNVTISGIVNTTVKLAGSGNIDSYALSLGSIESKEYIIELVASGGAPILLDGILISEKENEEQVAFSTNEWDPHPNIHEGPVSNSLILKYKECNQYYGMVWLYDNFEIREYEGKDLDHALRHNVHHHLRKSFKGNGKGHYSNIFMRPIALEPHENKQIYGMVCHGSLEEVEAFIREFQSNENDATCEMLYQHTKQADVTLPVNPSGEKYRFSQQRLAATTLTNVVFPVYTRRSFIRHYTPGRWWDSLYTWDSGFIGLGLTELNIARAADCLQTYLTEPGDAHAAFMHHGSMVPVQHYQYLEIWNKTQSREFLHTHYAALKQYYMFYSGNHDGSTTRTFKSNLLKTWDYFYNSGGWDDYPPQVYVNRQRLQHNVAPVINTAHCIRIAKIMKMAADEQGYQEDADFFNREIALLTEAIQNHAWDESTGYYGYVCHDNHGEPMEILKFNDEVNYNMGLDGAYPLVAGICDPRQTDILLEHLFNEEEIWSPIGLSTVSQKAPYYEEEGYWNGAVWMPHQWFFWKTMIDLGRLDLARQIAETGLDVWENEVRQTYNCYEHFIIKTGRGAGWHHFGGLSNPVLNWFSAYHRPGVLTCGFDVWIRQKEVNPENTRLTAQLKYGGQNQTFSLIVTMNPQYQYQALWNEVQVDIIQTGDGVLNLELDSPKQDDSGLLSIQVKQ